MMRKRASRSTMLGMARTRLCMSRPFGATCSMRSQKALGKKWVNASIFITAPFLSREHRPRELETHRAARALLAAGAAVPALVRIAHHRQLAPHVDHVERAIQVAQLAAVAFRRVDHRRHARLPS